ncbi:MAG: phage tail family protein [Clostridium sp.]|nr:phage tail family protein [Clostridium sp.]
MRSTIMFNEEYIPEWISVNRIGYKIFPTFNIDESTEEGEINKRKSSRVIQIDFSCNRRVLLIKEKEIELINWLKGDNFNYSKLKLPNDPGSYYMAKVKSNIDITGSLRRAKGRIEFLCIGNKVEDNLNSINLNNNREIYCVSTAEVKPRLKIKVLSQVSEIKISIKNSKYNNFIKLVGNFNQNDSIEIDMSNNKISKNGIVDSNIMSLDSYFHRLVPGENKYTISENSKCSVILEWQNEFI